jgi:hypothetical protein
MPTPRRWRRWRFHGSSAYHPDGLTDRVLEPEGVMMGTTDATFTAADLRLIEEDYRTLDEVCAERGIDPAGVEAMITSGLSRSRRTFCLTAAKCSRRTTFSFMTMLAASICCKVTFAIGL